MTTITRDTAIPFGKPGGPLRGKCLAELDDGSVQYLADSAKEREWADAARQEQSDRAAGIRRQGANGSPAPQSAPQAAPQPPGHGPGHPSAPQPYNGGKASKWEVLPLPPGGAGLAGKHYLDTLIVATAYAFNGLIGYGWPQNNATAEAAEKLAVSAVIACTDRGIDLMAELRTAKAMPKPAAEQEEEPLPF